MRRLILAVILGALSALLATPVVAAPPNDGCGPVASGWHAVTFAQWIEATEGAEGAPLPPDVEAEILATLAEVYDDVNPDGLVCQKFLQATLTPAFPPGFFNIKDNTSAAD
jgi:hypothetical protein